MARTVDCLIEVGIGHLASVGVDLHALPPLVRARVWWKDTGVEPYKSGIHLTRGSRWIIMDARAGAP